MIPLRDRNPTRSFPLLTVLLIAANVLVFLREPLLGSARVQSRFFVCNAAIPWEVMHQRALPASLTGCGAKSVWLSILLSMFLHGGLLHIAGNMLYLWIFGNNIEDTLGRARFLVLYFGAGLAATLLHSLVAQGGSDLAHVTPSAITPMVGASGAIAGVLGAYILLFPRARVTTLFIFFLITVLDVPAALLLGVWFLLQVFSGVASVGATASSGVAFFAHVGGFLAGMIMIGVFGGRKRLLPPPSPPPFPFTGHGIDWG